MHIDELPTPALVLDLERLDRNLSSMADRARTLGVALRPHIKTHKCIEIGQRQRKLGAKGITVSTLYEAGVFADHGFDDITWAFPFIPSRLTEAQRLVDRIQLNVVVDSMATLQVLDRSTTPFSVWLKVDCGYHRAGVDPAGTEAMHIARSIVESKSLTFGGLLSHSGHSYNVTGEAVADVAEQERHVMVSLADRLQHEGIEIRAVSVGSTPSMRKARSLEGVNEARPGNYALFDYTQTCIGSCEPIDCAVTVVTTVVSSHPGSKHCIVDAGALSLSKDGGPSDPFGPTMGEIYRDYAGGTLDPETRLTGLSQEHGKVNTHLEVGTRLRVLPNHSCLTVAQFDELIVVDGETVMDRWRVWRGRN